MKELPILFSGPMVRALLADTKTQTRRHMKTQMVYGSVAGLFASWYLPNRDGGGTLYPNGKEKILATCPYGQPGDRLWVRETYFAWGRWETRCSAKKGRDEWHFVDMTLECGKAYLYDADSPRPQPLAGKRDGGVTPKWWKRPAIFMPREASRITLEITSLRVERLQSISEADAIAEGIERPEDMSREAVEAMDVWPEGAERSCFNALNQPVHQYRRLWEQINGTGSWEANPWVWVVEFRRLP